MEEIGKKEPVDLQLLITMKPDGQIQVQGPVGNLLICFGMLEAAKMNLIDFAKSQQKIEVPNNRMMDFIRNKKN